MRSQVLTTRFSPDKYKLLKDLANQTWMTERATLEQSLQIFSDILTKKNIRESYKNIGNDKEIMDLAEEWIDDFIKSFDK